MFVISKLMFKLKLAFTLLFRLFNFIQFDFLRLNIPTKNLFKECKWHVD